MTDRDPISQTTPMLRYTVEYRWDVEARVWVVESHDIKGLVSEAPTLQDAMRSAAELAPDLLRMNGQELPA